MSDTDLTFAELQQQALHDDMDSAKYLSRCKQKINEALGNIFRTASLTVADFTEVVAYNAGVNVIAPIGNPWILIEAIIDTVRDVELEPIDLDEMAKLDPNATGIPQKYALTGTNLASVPGIRIWPKAAAAGSVTIRYRMDAPMLTADSDKPAMLPNNYRPMLAEYARSYLLRWEQEYDEADRWMGYYQQRLLQLLGDLQRRTSKPRQVPGTWAGSEDTPTFHRPGLF